jgi:hypothetical protein
MHTHFLHLTHLPTPFLVTLPPHWCQPSPLGIIEINSCTYLRDKIWKFPYMYTSMKPSPQLSY